MGKYEKLLGKILQGQSDANISFSELSNLLIKMGFEMRIKGSHHLFSREGIEEKINLQKDGSKAKVYQVKQVRALILKNNLQGEL